MHILVIEQSEPSSAEVVFPGLLEDSGIQGKITGAAPVRAFHILSLPVEKPDVIVVECMRDFDTTENIIEHIRTDDKETPILLLYVQKPQPTQEETCILEKYFKHLGVTTFVNAQHGYNHIALKLFETTGTPPPFKLRDITKELILVGDIVFLPQTQKVFRRNREQDEEESLTSPLPRTINDLTAMFMAILRTRKNTGKTLAATRELTRFENTHGDPLFELGEEEALLIQTLWNHAGEFTDARTVLESMYASIFHPEPEHIENMIAGLRDKLERNGVANADRYFAGTAKTGFILNDEPAERDPRSEMSDAENAALLGEVESEQQPPHFEHDLSKSPVRRPAGRTFQINGLFIDTEKGMAYNADNRRTCVLASSECLFLEALSEGYGRTVSYDDIRATIFRKPKEHTTESVKRIVQKLHKKLSEKLGFNMRDYIATVRGTGFALIRRNGNGFDPDRGDRPEPAGN